jgi:uncharacterized protein YxeA
MKEIIKEQELETVFEKGIGLENEFCEYLKTDLSWEKARVRSQMASKFNMRGTNVDVIAERIDIRGNKLKKIGILYAIFFILLIVIALFEEDSELQLLLLCFGLIFEVGGAFAFIYSVNLNKENAWVECKNLKTKVNISQVQKTVDEYKHYKESGNNEYKFVEYSKSSKFLYVYSCFKSNIVVISVLILKNSSKYTIFAFVFNPSRYFS